MTSDTRTSWLAYLSLAATAAIYGGWALVSKAATSKGIPPLIFAFYRCMGGAVLLFLALRLRPQLGPSTSLGTSTSRDACRFFCLGTLLAGNVCGFIIGSSLLPALTCSILQPTIPVVTMVAAAFLGVERATPRKLFSLAFCVVGAVIVVVHGAQPGVGGVTLDVTHSMLGFIAIAVNVVFSALYFVYQKELLQTYPPVYVTAMAYGWAAVIVFFAALLTSGLGWDAWTMSQDHTVWLCTAYAVCLTTALNYSILAWANQVTTPTTVTASSTLQPVTAALLSSFILGTSLTQAQACGSAVIITGLLMYVKAQLDHSKLDTFKPTDFL